MSKEIKNKERKVFLENLPTKEGVGALKGKQVIDWSESIGKTIKFKYEDIHDELTIINYEGGRIYVSYKNNKYDLAIQDFKRCKLGRILGRVTKEFKLNIGDVVNGTLVIIDKKKEFVEIKNKYIEEQKFYKIKCLECGFHGNSEYYRKSEKYEEHWAKEGNLLHKKGCPCCNNQITVPGINDIPTTAPWMVKYFQGGYEEAKKYTESSGVSLNFICPDCNNIKNTKTRIGDLNRQGLGCSCGDGFSYGHKYVYNILKQLKLSFKDNFSPRWCKFYNKYNKSDYKGEYDFIIENKKIILEVDGGFHRSNNKMNGRTVEESKYIDEIKDDLAKKNGYEIIRIFYEDKKQHIKNNIESSNLGNIFKLNSIDWVECEEYASKNISKEVATYWNNKQECETTKDLSKHFNMHRGMIINYLNKWSEIGYCSYNGKEEMKKVKNRGESCCKQVEISKNGIIIDWCKSCHEVQDKSIIITGVRLTFQGVSEACRTGKQYKGYTFRYITKEEYEQRKSQSA